jgi:hypothetical protein
MAKKMELVVDKVDPITGKGLRIDLLIERDAGNPVCILMGGKHAHENWSKLRALSEKALMYLDHPGLIDTE